MNGVFLSQAALNTLSPVAKAEVLACLSLSVPGVASATSGPTDLSLTQVRKFLERCSTKTSDALKEIARAPARGFTVTRVANALGVDLNKEDLRGVWGGITKRTRAILGDPSARVIDWEYRDNDWHGRVSVVTHQALKTALRI